MPERWHLLSSAQKTARLFLTRYAVCHKKLAQAVKKFSLGAAVLGCVPADGCDTPIQEAPDAWLLCFIEQHADAAVWSGLFISCRGGRQLALTHARKATLMLHCAHRVPDEGWQAQLVAVRQALSVRGAQSTRVKLRPFIALGDGPDPYLWVARMGLVPGMLWGVGRGVTELDVDLESWSQTGALSSTLASSFPNITSLTLMGSMLPTPALWPRLQSIDVSSHRGEEKWLLQTIADYLPQLKSLKLPSDYHGRRDWSSLFGRSYYHPVHSPLTHFEANSTLTDQVAVRLTVVAPGLEHLSVYRIAADTGQYTDAPWSLKHLQITERMDAAEVLPALARLPRPVGGRMSVMVGGAKQFPVTLNVTTNEVRTHMLAAHTRISAHAQSAFVTPLLYVNQELVQLCAAICVVSAPIASAVLHAGHHCHTLLCPGLWCCAQGIDHTVAECLALWCLHASEVSVECSGVRPADQPAALRRTLQQLADMQAPDAVVWLSGWQWSDQLGETVADSMAALQHLRVGVRMVGPLTDVLLAAVLRMGPHMQRLSVPSVALYSDHSDVSWQITDLSTKALDIVQLLRLPASDQLQLRAGDLCIAKFRRLLEVRQARTHTHTHTHTHAYLHYKGVDILHSAPGSQHDMSHTCSHQIVHRGNALPCTAPLHTGGSRLPAVAA